jgi:hypothetical protein
MTTNYPFQRFIFMLSPPHLTVSRTHPQDYEVVVVVLSSPKILFRVLNMLFVEHQYLAQVSYGVHLQKVDAHSLLLIRQKPVF